MSKGSTNSNLRKAAKIKADEFYTHLPDIEKELRHYKHHFKNKVVYCNCDDPRVSNFFNYFSLNFETLGLKKLITTCYKNQDWNLFSQNTSEQAVYLEYEGDKNGNKVPDPEEIGIHPLKGDGDFRSEESIELLKQADIVVTNPPFSLFREYVDQLITFKKKFLIVGHQNAITYREIFKLLKENKIWLGNFSGDMSFKVPDHYPEKSTRFWVDDSGQKWRSMGNTCWFTNLHIKKREEELILYKKYTKKEYPFYDNYNAINVDKVAEIMNLANREFEATIEQYRYLANREINSDDLEKYIKLVMIGEKKLQANPEAGTRILNKIIPLFEKGRGNDMTEIKGTYWAAYNSISEYLQHEKGSDEAIEWIASGLVNQVRF